MARGRRLFSKEKALYSDLCTLSISLHIHGRKFFNFRGNKTNPCEINRPVFSSVVAVEQPTPKHARVPLSLPADDYFRAIAIFITIAGQCSMMLIYLSLSLPKCHFHYHCQAMFDDAYLLVLVVAQLSTKDWWPPHCLDQSINFDLALDVDKLCWGKTNKENRENYRQPKQIMSSTITFCCI